MPLPKIIQWPQHALIPVHSQLRSEKGLHVADTSLHFQRSNITSLKFNGKLDVTRDKTTTLTELNMGAFLRSVSNIAERFGLEK